MKTCLLLGGNGFIGIHLCRRLVHQYKVIIYTEMPFLPEDLQGKVDITNGNFILEERFEHLIERVDVVFHLISTTGPSDSTAALSQEMKQNIFPTVRLLEALKAKQEVLFVFFSSGGTVYGDSLHMPIPESMPLHPLCSYGVQKATLEMYIQMYGALYGLKYLILRPSNPYGLGQNPNRKQGIIPIFVKNVLSGNSISIWGDGLNVRDYIFMEDMLDAVEKLLQANISNQIYNIGSGYGYTIMQVLELIGKYTGKDAREIQFFPPRVCDVRYNILDVSKLQNDLGWKPKVSITDGIKQLVKEIQK